MKPLIQLKKTTPTLFIPLAVICFGLAPMARAVGPDTEGNIPGANNGEGIGVLVSRTSGVWNTGTGFEALNHLTSGNQNTATGLRALFSNINGGFNTATGVYSLYSNTAGILNTATGAYSLWKNTTGAFNNAHGNDALFRNTTGQGNNAFGAAALVNNVTGIQNTAIGDLAGVNVTGSGNVNIGAGVSTPAGVDNETRIRNIGTTPLNTGMFVEVDNNGKLGFVTSSRRYKHDIEPMADASEALFALKPVTFRYNCDIDPAHAKMFGLIAEDVAEVSPNLAVRDAKGEVVAIRSDSINAMLLNEFLKEHRKVEELQATVAQQQKGMEVLTAQLKEQAAQIQKVSAQLKVSKPATKVVVNKP